MTQDATTYYVWIGGSCDYGHKERAGGAAVVIELMEQREQSGACSNYAESRQKKTEGQLESGKGFADLVFLPRKFSDKPAMIVELKYDKNADTAISQIHRKEYQGKVLEHTDNLLLVGINYDKKTKKHTCTIEKYADK